MAPVRTGKIVTVQRKEGVRKFQPKLIYKGGASWDAFVYMSVLSRTSDDSILIKAVEGTALDHATLDKLEQSQVERVSLFTDKNDAEYTYVLCRRISVLNHE